MSDDREIFKKRVDELWDSAQRNSGMIFEKAQHDFAESIENELTTLKPSQYEEFMNVAKEHGWYFPSEDLTPWQDYYSKDELEDMGIGE